jgi:hypothetical protein
MTEGNLNHLGAGAFELTSRRLPFETVSRSPRGACINSEVEGPPHGGGQEEWGGVGGGEQPTWPRTASTISKEPLALADPLARAYLGGDACRGGGA